MNENTECRYGMLTTSQILDVIIGSQGLKKSANGYECKINLYKCNLKVKQVYNLIEFGIDPTMSRLHPLISINAPISTCEDMIPDYIKETYGDEFSIVTFSILHEVGHWEYFCKMNYTPIEYGEKEKIRRKEVYVNNWEEDKMAKEYRNIESEKVADKYALNRLEETLKNIVNKYFN